MQEPGTDIEAERIYLKVCEYVILPIEVIFLILGICVISNGKFHPARFSTYDIEMVFSIGPIVAWMLWGVVSRLALIRGTACRSSVVGWSGTFCVLGSLVWPLRALLSNDVISAAIGLLFILPIYLGIAAIAFFIGKARVAYICKRLNYE